jgi:hypothetical protein
VEVGDGLVEQRPEVLGGVGRQVGEADAVRHGDPACAGRSSRPPRAPVRPVEPTGLQMAPQQKSRLGVDERLLLRRHWVGDPPDRFRSLFTSTPRSVAAAHEPARGAASARWRQLACEAGWRPGGD